MMVLRPAAMLLVCRVRALVGDLDYAVRGGMRWMAMDFEKACFCRAKMRDALNFSHARYVE